MDNRYNEKYGVALFDSATSAGSGWACISGRDPFFITSSGDLANDITWLTNLSLNTFVKKGLSKTPRLRAETFLRSKISSIILELGIKDAHPRIQAKTLAEVVGNTMQFAHYHLGITSAPFGTLNNGIRQIFLPSETPYSIDVHSAAEKACQPYVNCEKEIDDDNTELIPLLFHRYQYARQILSSKIPSGKWTPVDLASIGETQKIIDAWVAATNKPLLIKITVDQLDASASKLINYGSGAGLIATRARDVGASIAFNDHTWVTSVEYRMLRARGRVTIQGILMAEGWVSNPVPLPIYDQYGEYSYSLGLYCESLWTSLTRSINGNAAKTPGAAWIHSIDRLLCFEKAEKLHHDHGISIHGYGYGRIVVQIGQQQREKIPAVCLALNMISPMAVENSRPSANLPVEIKKPTSSQITQLAIIRGDKAFFSAVDKRAKEEAEAIAKQNTSIEMNI